jgi:hypothetical protein
MEAAFTSFFTWLFSDNSSSNNQTVQQDNTDYAKLQAEYKAKVEAQIADVKSKYETMMTAQTLSQKQEVVDEMKDRFAVSEATKAVKQLNCAAAKSILITKKKIYDFNDFDNLEGDAEEFSKLADFTNMSTKGCPPIKVSIPEVNAKRTVSFQQLYYGFILHRSDSIQFAVDTLKAKKIKNDSVIEVKKKKIEETKHVIEQQQTQIITATSQTNNNQLLQDALKELENASQELESAQSLDAKMQTEIENDLKTVETLKKMRGTYDIDTTQNPTGK